jgi:hypothetical protein
MKLALSSRPEARDSWWRGKQLDDVAGMWWMTWRASGDVAGMWWMTWLAGPTGGVLAVQRAAPGTRLARGPPNLGSTWGQPGVNLGSTWGQLGVILGSTWRGQPAVNLRLNATPSRFTST